MASRAPALRLSPPPSISLPKGGGAIRGIGEKFAANPVTGTGRDHFFLPRRFHDPFGETTTLDYDNHNLLPTRTTDPLDNVVQAQNDYRVMEPRLITDPNSNRSQVVFDGLGMVVATAVMGKVSQNVGDSLAGFSKENPTRAEIDAFRANPKGAAAYDLLQQATTRVVYDLDRYRQSGQPVFAATIARETHVSNLAINQRSKVQISFSYSDGFGREIQKKIQAEPGPLVAGGPEVNPRWVGGGWTIFNNKGKPVRQYEPFFDDTHDFKFGHQVGVSPILFYDPVERVIATLHPNHSYQKVVFDPWRQETWDVNDTVAFDPRADEDIEGYTAAYFRTRPADWQTWLQQRGVDPASPPADTPSLASERKAAVRALSHAGTPTVAYFDALGRSFLTVAHNRFKRKQNGEIIEEKYPTRVILDIEGNQRAVRDASAQTGDKQGRVVMRYHYDMLGNRIRQDSMEAGARWTLNNIAGNPIYAWDSRDHAIRTIYDALQRPTEARLSEGGTAATLVERTVYGEGMGGLNNHRGKVYQVFDGAGVVTNEAYDFKGNLLLSNRRLVTDYKQTPNWSAAAPLEPGSYPSAATYDGLNRPVTLTTPDNSVIRPAYNEANLLESVEANLRGAAVATTFVRDIDYNAKGQRERIEYGNSTFTQYEYDIDTFRSTCTSIHTRSG
ncbi:MAG TPA: hypothetical protein VJ810_01730 [Blastocatellia bacterium]|nr:hypothetical protein [Blastocatellia bacterium]